MRSTLMVVPGAMLASLAALVALSPSAARADEDKPSGISDASAKKSDEPLYVRMFVTSGMGMGLRFNNPYRLARQLGSTAEGPSLTAPYFSLGAGATFGDPRGFQHGGSLRWDQAVQGVSQHVLVPSYVLLRRAIRFEAWGRFALPIVLNPNPNLGGELALGGAWFVRAGLGISAEIIGDLFFGAATPDTKRPIYPVLSGQLGLIVEWERLP